MKLVGKTLYTHIPGNSSLPFCRYILSPDFVPNIDLGIETEQGREISAFMENVLHFNEGRQAIKKQNT